MTLKGRSLDDLPLAAYSTGVEPDDPPDDQRPADRAADATHLETVNAAAAPTFAPASLGADHDLGAAAASRATRRLAIPPWLANPRSNVRDPRLLMTSVIGVGVVLLVASLVFGGGPAAGGVDPNTTASVPPPAPTVPPPTGDATVDLSGKLTGSYLLAGASGTGPASNGRISVTWTDAAGASLVLAGPASSGTRTTDPTFTLSWSLMVEGAPVTFTSDAGECTVGMAVQPRTVSGSFVCKKLQSDDGSQTVDLRGTYRT